MIKYFFVKPTANTVSTVAKDLIRIVPSTVANVEVYIHEAGITFETTAMMSMKVALGIGRSGGGTNALSSIASVPLNTTNFDCNAGIYGFASTNTTNLKYYDSKFINTLNGYSYIPDIHWSPRIYPGSKLILKIDSTHTDDVVAQPYIIFSESC